MTIKASLLSWSNVAKATVASLTIATAVHLARDPEDVQKLPHQISMTVKSVEDIISKKFGQLDGLTLPVSGAILAILAGGIGLGYREKRQREIEKQRIREAIESFIKETKPLAEVYATTSIIRFLQQYKNTDARAEQKSAAKLILSHYEDNPQILDTVSNGDGADIGKVIAGMEDVYKHMCAELQKADKNATNGRIEIYNSIRRLQRKKETFRKIRFRLPDNLNSDPSLQACENHDPQLAILAMVKIRETINKQFLALTQLDLQFRKFVQIKSGAEADFMSEKHELLKIHSSYENIFLGTPYFKEWDRAVYEVQERLQSLRKAHKAKNMDDIGLLSGQVFESIDRLRKAREHITPSMKQDIIWYHKIPSFLHSRDTFIKKLWHDIDTSAFLSSEKKMEFSKGLLKIRIFISRINVIFTKTDTNGNKEYSIKNLRSELNSFDIEFERLQKDILRLLSAGTEHQYMYHTFPGGQGDDFQDTQQCTENRARMLPSGGSFEPPTFSDSNSDSNFSDFWGSSSMFGKFAG
ncbi:MAG: hypothetical protein PHH70_01425 [Candidatus Gracilibacteria bacterium]|nr:hypothetical protein [Candidatus Gracilibacteria bacterium]